MTYHFTGHQQCVEAVRQVSLSPAAALVGFWVNSPPTIQLALNVHDATGQTLRYMLLRPLEATDPNSWYQLSVSLDQPDNWSGGANDGKIHDAITSLAIAVTPLETAVSGTIAFDDVVVWPPMPIFLDLSARPITPAQPGSADLIGRLGVNIHFHNGADDPGLQIAADAGFSWVRTDLTWREVETQPGVYDFSRYDQILSEAEAHHMKVLFILDYGNAFYTGGPRVPPTTADAINAFSDYAGDVARHFAGRNVAYEIWNEPNTSMFWPPQPDPQAYAQLADETAHHIRAADPAAQVIVGGLALFDFAFLRSFLAQPHSATYDAISVHPYLDQPERLAELAAQMRGDIFDALPYHPPIWISEWGYTSLCPAKPASVVVCDQQASMVARELLSAWTQEFPLINYYELRDRDPAASQDAEGHFGLIVYDGTAKPALAAVRTLTSLARGRRYMGLIPLAPSSLHALRLDSPDDAVVALWLDREGQNVSIALLRGTSENYWL